MEEIQDQASIIDCIRQSMKIQQPELYEQFFCYTKKEFPIESYRLIFIDDLEIQQHDQKERM